MGRPVAARLVGQDTRRILLMWKSATTGLVLLAVGAAKFAEHTSRTPSLEDYLAFRCAPGASALDAGTASHMMASNLHCWGCPVLAIGAGLVAFAAFSAVRSSPRRATSAIRP
jgi:hypothetical protein